MVSDYFNPREGTVVESPVDRRGKGAWMDHRKRGADNPAKKSDHGMDHSGILA